MKTHTFILGFLVAVLLPATALAGTRLYDGVQYNYPRLNTHYAPPQIEHPLVINTRGGNFVRPKRQTDIFAGGSNSRASQLYRVSLKQYTKRLVKTLAESGTRPRR